MQLILGSSSPFRKQLLQQLQLEFETDSPDIDETPLDNETVEE
ncbi:MAG: Maf family protein, partial [Gammaproteobacteria bacterium]|nr:Maf family protein [Gammaproteobacteria bacterium]